MRFHIAPENFPGFKVVTPVYAGVEFFVDRYYRAHVTGIMFPPSVFPVVEGRGRIVTEIESAVQAIAEQRKKEVCHA